MNIRVSDVAMLAVLCPVIIVAAVLTVKRLISGSGCSCAYDHYPVAEIEEAPRGYEEGRDFPSDAVSAAAVVADMEMQDQLSLRWIDRVLREVDDSDERPEEPDGDRGH